MKEIKTPSVKAKEIVKNAVDNNYIDILKELLSNDKIEFGIGMRSNLSKSSGVYRIITRDGNDSEQTIYVGRTKNLQKRLYSDLLMGNAGSHTLRNKLIKSNLCKNEEDAKQYIINKYLCQVQIINDEQERKFFKHFAISIFRPIYND